MLSPLQVATSGSGLSVQGHLLRQGPDGKGSTTRHLTSTGKRVSQLIPSCAVVLACSVACHIHQVQQQSSTRFCVMLPAGCCRAPEAYSQESPRSSPFLKQHHELFWQESQLNDGSCTRLPASTAIASVRTGAPVTCAEVCELPRLAMSWQLLKIFAAAVGCDQVLTQ